MNRETTLQKIIRKTGKKPIECKCSLCKKQCDSVCLGTPEDILRLIEAGYADKLSVTEWYVGVMMGATSSPVFMVQPKETKQGCIFFSNGLCDLHSLCLKPTEGRLSHHSTKIENFKFRKSIAWNVAKEWLNEDNAEIVKKIVKTVTN